MRIVLIRLVWSNVWWQTNCLTRGPAIRAGTRTPSVCVAGIVVDGRRRDVVVEAAVLVVDDHEQGVVPGRAAGERFVELEHERLPGADIRGRVIVVGVGVEDLEVDEVRVDPRDVAQLALRGVVEEAVMPDDHGLAQLR